jgi:hypothetical protein
VDIDRRAFGGRCGRPRRYRDNDQDAYWILPRANPNRILSGSFVIFDRDVLECGDRSGSLVGAGRSRTSRSQMDVSGL